VSGETRDQEFREREFEGAPLVERERLNAFSNRARKPGNT
jgi:hypothetical protein